MTGNPRVYTNLTSKQYAELSLIGIKQDRSMSWLISKAISNHIATATAYSGEADIKVMSRTSEANAAAVKAVKGDQWRYVNTCVQRLIDNAV